MVCRTCRAGACGNAVENGGNAVPGALRDVAGENGVHRKGVAHKSETPVPLSLTQGETRGARRKPSGRRAGSPSNSPLA